ncbi:MAG TPA: hypothetical protein VLM37_09210 [Fibrobacteraceae bacterium]|nr:hypothetical protein [Fibrobacteraceae bacterium]
MKGYWIWIVLILALGVVLGCWRAQSRMAELRQTFETLQHENQKLKEKSQALNLRLRSTDSLLQLQLEESRHMLKDLLARREKQDSALDSLQKSVSVADSLRQLILDRYRMDMTRISQRGS